MSNKSLFLSIALGISFCANAADGPRPFAAEDVFDLEYANDPRISPDGAQVVYERRANDIMADSTLSNLWTIGHVRYQHGRHDAGMVERYIPGSNSSRTRNEKPRPLQRPVFL